MRYILSSLRVIFTRQVCEGSRGKLQNSYALPKRTYVGPTSLDAALSFLMANIAHVREGTYVMDPFVGTGGILVASAHFGAVTLGMDIDMRILKGTTGVIQDGRNPLTNFEQYGLKSPDLIRGDMNKLNLRPGVMFDAIITDPPYGLRAGARKSGMRPNRESYIITSPDHIPATQPYPVEECYADLFDFVARRLVLGGRFVYLFPTTNEYKDEHLPSHPCFKLIANCEQKLQGATRRRLIASVKVKEFEEGMVADVPEFTWQRGILTMGMKRKQSDEEAANAKIYDDATEK